MKKVQGKTTNLISFPRRPKRCRNWELDQDYRNSFLLLYSSLLEVILVGIPMCPHNLCLLKIVFGPCSFSKA